MKTRYVTGVALVVGLLAGVVPVAVRPFSDPERHRVAVFTPTTEGNTYWPEVHRVMAAAAADLELEVTFHEFDVRDRFSKAEEGVRILREDPPPDGAIFSVAFGQALPLVEEAEALDIPFFIEGPLFPSERAELGEDPRKRYRNWIGYFHEDEMEKGYLLGRELLRAAIEKGQFASDGTVHVVGLGGDPAWYGSELRERGLRKAVTEEPRARLMQTVRTHWTEREGREMTERLLQRYPEVSVVWAASDQLALGAAEALEALGRVPGSTAFTGGLDLSMIGLEAVRDGILAATVAGTPRMYAEVLVYLFDYLNGLDFIDSPGTEITSTLLVADHDSAETLIEERASYEQIDYRTLSRYHQLRRAQ